MSSARIMVVDDDPQIRRVLRTALVAQGYEVVDARNGEEALEMLRDEKLDLVILDVNMPGMSGQETCRLMRSSSDIVIIMLTVRDAESDKVEALDAGADDYMTKPFSSPELLARIRAAFRRSPGRFSEMQVIRFDDVEINFNLRRVAVGGREARLTPKEFDLLQYMVAHPNVPIPHILPSVKFIENPGALGFRQPLAVIMDGDNEILSGHMRRDLDRRPSWRILECIVDQLPERQLNEIGIDESARQIRRRRNIHPAAVALRFHLQQHFFNDTVEGMPLAIDLNLAGFDPSDMRRFRNQPAQPLRFLIDNRE